MAGVSHRALGLALVGGAILCPAAASAQQTTDVTPPAPLSTQPGAQPDAAGPAPSSNIAPNTLNGRNDSGQIEQIIVSARRRNETIQTTPVAVTAIAPAQLQAAAAIRITDLQGAAPNVLITTQSTGAATANISIRGIAFADVEKSFDPAVGVNVDGVYIGTSTGQLLDAFDIGSIEILRGPQGTLFGRNTIAGVINVRRTRPTGEWGGKFESTFGSYGQFGARGVLNMPIVQGVLAAKLFEMHQEDTGFLRDYYTGKHLGGSNSENFGAAFLLTPSSNFDALLTLEEQQQDFTTYNGSLSDSNSVFCNFGLLNPAACNRNNTNDIYTIFKGPDNDGQYRARAATLEMNLRTGPIKFASITSYRQSKEAQFADYSTQGNYTGDRRQKYHQFSQELRASGNLFTGFDYVAGLYYFESRYHLIQLTSIPAFGVINNVQDTAQRSRSEAAFADFNWNVFPKIRISGGGRFTHDNKRNINPLLTDPSGNVGVTASKGWSRFTPRVTVDYRPNNDIMVYASWSRGYRSGGFNGRGQTYYSATIPYNPETVSAYEVGLKSEFLDRKVALNLAGFYTDYKSIQQSTTVTLPPPSVGNETIVTNAGGAHIYGAEADLTMRPTKLWTVRGSFGYTHSRFRDFVVNQLVSGVVRQFDFSKVGLIYAPKVTASINSDYKIPVGRSELHLYAGYRYLARYDQQIAADPATVIPATGTIIVQRNDPKLRSDRQNLVDASVGFVFPMNRTGARAHVTVFGRNLLNDRGTATAFNVAAFPTLWSFTAAREPRVLGVQLGFEF